MTCEALVSFFVTAACSFCLSVCLHPSPCVCFSPHLSHLLVLARSLPLSLQEKPRPKQRQRNGMKPTWGRAVGNGSCSACPRGRNNREVQGGERGGKSPLSQQHLSHHRRTRERVPLNAAPYPVLFYKWEAFPGVSPCPSHGVPTWLLWKFHNPTFMKHVQRGGGKFALPGSRSEWRGACARGEPGLSSFCLSSLPVSPSWAVRTAPETERKREYTCVHTLNLSPKPQQRA